jgi:AcrR family transcriptional regulator
MYMYSVHPERSRAVPQRPGLSRDKVVAHALAIVDRDGPTGVTMRQLGSELGDTPMALYNHVAGTQAVLDAVADRVAAQVRLPTRDREWPERLRQVFHELRAAYLRHPRAVPLVQGATSPSPALLGPMEATLDALAAAGLRAGTAVSAWISLVAFTNGHVAYQLNGHLDGGTPHADAIDGDRFPHVERATAGVADWDASFASGLEGLIAAIGVTAEAPRPTGR